MCYKLIVFLNELIIIILQKVKYSFETEWIFFKLFALDDTLCEKDIVLKTFTLVKSLLSI